MKECIALPEDFDSMGSEEIFAMFEGTEDKALAQYSGSVIFVG
jgi:hypothetical protein